MVDCASSPKDPRKNRPRMEFYHEYGQISVLSSRILNLQLGLAARLHQRKHGVQQQLYWNLHGAIAPNPSCYGDRCVHATDFLPLNFSFSKSNHDSPLIVPLTLRTGKIPRCFAEETRVVDSIP